MGFLGPRCVAWGESATVGGARRTVQRSRSMGSRERAARPAFPRLERSRSDEADGLAGELHGQPRVEFLDTDRDDAEATQRTACSSPGRRGRVLADRANALVDTRATGRCRISRLFSRRGLKRRLRSRSSRDWLGAVAQGDHDPLLQCQLARTHVGTRSVHGMASLASSSSIPIATTPKLRNALHARRLVEEDACSRIVQTHWSTRAVALGGRCRISRLLSPGREDASGL
jgi:hypothetical protein